MSSLYIRPATLALVISTAYVIIYALSYAGIDVPIVRQVLGLALIFMPGYLAARLLGLRGVESLLISVGLALSLVMFAGAATNFIYLALGVSKPLVGPPVVITLLILVAILALAHYIKYPREYIRLERLRDIISPSTFIIVTMPLWSVVGVYMVTAHANNIVLMAQIVFFAALPILVAINKIPRGLHPITLWSMALSLSLQNTLPSLYPRQSDVAAEQYIVRLNNGYWNPAVESNYSAMLSTTILLPLLSEITGLDLNWLYKLILPIIYSVVPIVLYYAYSRLINTQVAYLSSYLFTSFYMYYTFHVANIKTVSSMLFFALIILLIAHSEVIDKHRRFALSVIFGFSIIVSHYTLAYIFMFYIVATPFVVMVISRFKESPKVLTLPFAVLYLIFTFIWYSQIGGGRLVKELTNFVSGSLKEGLMGRVFVRESYVGHVLGTQISLSLEMLKVLTGLFVVAAMFWLLYYLVKRQKMNLELTALASLSLLVGASTFLSNVSNIVTPDRVFHTNLAVLSPFIVLGALTIVSLLRRNAARAGLLVISVLMAIYLLVNTGFIAELQQEFPGATITLSMSRIESSGTLSEKAYLYRLFVPNCDVAGALWLSKYGVDKRVYTDILAIRILTEPLFRAEIDSRRIVRIIRGMRIDNGYIYLHRIGYVYQIAVIWIPTPGALLDYHPLSQTILINKIYDNGCSAVYIR
ncbi:MAG: DUF2206 domain-containing protein [Pyrobaculum sp.]